MYFNDIDMCEYLIVNDVRRSLLPPIEIKSIKIPGKIGEKFIKKDLGMRIIEVDITIEGFGHELRNNAREIANILNQDEPKKLFFSDELDKYNMAILSGDTNLSDESVISEATLVFICLDPFSISQDLITLGLNGKIINNGTYKSTGIITVNITSTVNHLQVKLKETGEFIRLEDSFVNGDTIIIDLDDEYITKNGYSAMKDLTFESDFFDLPVGEFEIQLSSGIGILEFRERWL